MYWSLVSFCHFNSEHFRFLTLTKKICHGVIPLTVACFHIIPLANSHLRWHYAILVFLSNISAAPAWGILWTRIIMGSSMKKSIIYRLYHGRQHPVQCRKEDQWFRYLVNPLMRALVIQIQISDLKYLPEGTIPVIWAVTGVCKLLLNQDFLVSGECYQPQVTRPSELPLSPICEMMGTEHRSTPYDLQTWNLSTESVSLEIFDRHNAQ